MKIDSFLKTFLQLKYQEVFPDLIGFELNSAGCALCNRKTAPKHFSGYVLPGRLVEKLQVCNKCFKAATENSYKNAYRTETYYVAVITSLREATQLEFKSYFMDFKLIGKKLEPTE